MGRRKELLFVGVLAGLIGMPHPLAAADVAEDPDEQLLRQAGIRTDTDSLLAVLRERPVSDPNPERVQRLIRQLGSENFQERESATKELKTFGRVALEPLRKAVQGGDAEVATRAKSCIEDIEFHTGWQFPAAVMKLLVRHRPAGLVPALLETLDHPEATFRKEAYDSLCQLLGPDDFPGVLKAVKDKRPLLRAGAIRLTYKYADRPKVFVPLLLEALRDEHVVVRRAAAGYLCQFGPQEGVVPALIEALKEKDEAPPSELSVASAAADGLARMREKARPAIPPLMELSKTGSKRDRQAALQALGYIGKRDRAVAPTVVALLVEVLQDKTQAVANRVMAAGALGIIGPDAKAAVPGLREVLQGEDAEEGGRLHGTVLSALGAIGPEAAAAVPDLIAILRDRKQAWWNRGNAAEALGNIGPTAKAAIPALTEAVKDEDYRVSEEAARALERVTSPESK